MLIKLKTYFYVYFLIASTLQYLVYKNKGVGLERERERKKKQGKFHIFLSSAFIK